MRVPISSGSPVSTTSSSSSPRRIRIAATAKPAIGDHAVGDQLEVLEQRVGRAPPHRGGTVAPVPRSLEVDD